MQIGDRPRTDRPECVQALMNKAVGYSGAGIIMDTLRPEKSPGKFLVFQENKAQLGYTKEITKSKVSRSCL